MMTMRKSVLIVALASSLAACAGPAGRDGTNGTSGSDGADGTNGIDGANGTTGANGTNGTDGLTSLLRLSEEPEGDNCDDGGTRIEAGIDLDRDGVLDDDEVTQTSFVCFAQPPPTTVPGSWSGNVNITHPDFAGPPVDSMTIDVSADGRLHFFGFGEFLYEFTFGTPPLELPLDGEADAFVCADCLFEIHVTVLSADWRDDGFDFSFQGVNLPSTPSYDMTTTIHATLVDGNLQVVFDAQGVQYSAPLVVHAEGVLSVHTPPLTFDAGSADADGGGGSFDGGGGGFDGGGGSFDGGGGGFDGGPAGDGGA